MNLYLSVATFPLDIFYENVINCMFCIDNTSAEVCFVLSDS